MDRAIMAAQLACVSRSMCSLLLGPDAAPLWKQVSVRQLYIGYTQSQAGGLHRLLATLGHWLSSIHIEQDKWEAGPLLALVRRLPNLRSARIKAAPFVSAPAVTAAVMAALPSSLQALDVAELQEPSAFPVKLQKLTLNVMGPMASAEVEDAFGSSVSQAQLDILRACKLRHPAACKQQLLAMAALQHLTELHLFMFNWRWTSPDLQPLLALPCLNELSVCFQAKHKHDISTVLVPSTCRLSIAVFPGPEVSHMLQQIQSLPLAGLSVRASAFDASDEVALAACHISHLLVLCCSDAAWRLQHRPRCASCVVRCRQTPLD